MTSIGRRQYYYTIRKILYTTQHTAIPHLIIDIGNVIIIEQRGESPFSIPVFTLSLSLPFVCLNLCGCQLSSLDQRQRYRMVLRFEFSLVRTRIRYNPNATPPLHSTTDSMQTKTFKILAYLWFV